MRAGGRGRWWWAGVLAVAACGGQSAAPGGAQTAWVGGGEAAASYGGAEASPATTTVTTTAVTTTAVTTTTASVAAPVDPSQELLLEPTEEQPTQAPAYALLTAASVSDHDRRDNYLEFLGRHPHEVRSLGLDPTRRVRVRVVDAHGRPVNDARVEIRGQEGMVVGRTHADGVWDFHPGLSARAWSGRPIVRASAGEAVAETSVDVPSHGDGQSLVLRLGGATALAPEILDVGFAIDVTGSMEDELRYVNAEIGDIVRRVRAEAPETQVRVGAVFYRDRTDDVVVARIPFTSDVEGFARAMRGVQASGGGDYPEDMNAGLEAAFGSLEWTEGNAIRVLVLVADAPPKRYADAQYTYAHALADASARGIRVLPVAASGADRTVEVLFRAMGSITSTPYVYLTDDSGIGNPHLEADTDRVAVELFGELLVRLLTDDLAGRGMHEPPGFGPAGRG